MQKGYENKAKWLKGRAYHTALSPFWFPHSCHPHSSTSITIYFSAEMVAMLIHTFYWLLECSYFHFSQRCQPLCFTSFQFQSTCLGSLLSVLATHLTLRSFSSPTLSAQRSQDPLHVSRLLTLPSCWLQQHSARLHSRVSTCLSLL